MMEYKKWRVAEAMLAQHGENTNLNAEAIALAATETGHPNDVSFWTDIVSKIEVLLTSDRVRH
jgi:hypothetical protein